MSAAQDDAGQLDRLDFLGDRSANGLRQSHGLMVNYLYAPGEIEANHEAFAERGQIAASSSVRKLLPGKPLTAEPRKAAAKAAPKAAIAPPA